MLTPPDASSGAGLRDDGAVQRRMAGLAAGLAAVAVLGASGCSSFSDPSPSTGVDELVVPTPSADPSDFVDVIDNPWFVLDDAAYADGSGALVERTVAAGPDVAGVPTTAVTLGDATDLFAQDARGNVWWFGHDGPDGGWRAGSDDAQAGLVVPAEPRRGDGFRQAEVPDEDLRAEVLEVEDDTMVIGVVDGAEITRTTYTRGIGLELVETDTGEVVLARQVEGE